MPDELKYSLHKLFVMHGRMCPRCRVPPRVGPKGYSCPIEALVVRRRNKNVGEGGKGKEKGRGKRKVKVKEEEKDVESSEDDLLSGVNEESTA